MRVAGLPVRAENAPGDLVSGVLAEIHRDLMRVLNGADPVVILATLRACLSPG